ncbi:MAG: pro-sigmaK processing inhibitor BofA family protein [Clostridia bacterium]|jgi:inhibitor of the pro-sigma K processing machinery
MEYLSFLVALIVLYIVLKIIAAPVKIIIKLMINAFVGGVVLFLINLVGAGFGFALNITWLTSLIVGIFGVPGVVLVILLQIVM